MKCWHEKQNLPLIYVTRIGDRRKKTRVSCHISSPCNTDFQPQKCLSLSNCMRCVGGGHWRDPPGLWKLGFDSKTLKPLTQESAGPIKLGAGDNLTMSIGLEDGAPEPKPARLFPLARKFRITIIVEQLTRKPGGMVARFPNHLLPPQYLFIRGLLPVVQIDSLLRWLRIIAMLRMFRGVARSLHPQKYYRALETQFRLLSVSSSSKTENCELVLSKASTCQSWGKIWRLVVLS